jgi:hypothetical protein
MGCGVGNRLRHGMSASRAPIAEGACLRARAGGVTGQGRARQTPRPPGLDLPHQDPLTPARRFAVGPTAWPCGFRPIACFKRDGGKADPIEIVVGLDGRLSLQPLRQRDSTALAVWVSRSAGGRSAATAWLMVRSSASRYHCHRVTNPAQVRPTADPSNWGFTHYLSMVN